MIEPSRHRRAAGGIPWTRGLFGLAVAGPALAIGGVHPEVLALWVVVVGALTWRIVARARGPLQRPWPALVLVGLSGWTLLAAVPGLRGAMAPGIDAWVLEATPDLEAWTSVSVRPADTVTEAIRLLALAGLALAAAQLSWRVSASAVALGGLAVAGVGFVHAFLGATKIYGAYAAADVGPYPRTALLGTFVNPDHQSGLLLLALFAAAALAVDQLHGARTARDAAKAEQRRDRGLAMIGAVGLLLPALLLSLSRGALLCVALLGPIGLAVAVVRVPHSHGTTRPHSRRGPALLALLALGGLVAAVGRHGAWTELVTLFDDPSSAFEQKWAPAREALALIERSPVLGTGRGTFIDLLPRQVPGTDLVYTHVECMPITAVIEWGPWIGGAAMLAFVAWWVLALRHRAPVAERERRARALLLLGIAAVSLQSTVDFSLEFIGVGAPLAALVGALTPHGPGRTTGLPRRSALVVATLGATAIMMLAPYTWSRRARTQAAVSAGVIDLNAAMRWCPLGGDLHVVAARRALRRGDLDAAAHHAGVATRAYAGSIDAWLALAEVHARRGDPAQRDAAVSEALDLVRAPVPAPLLDYIRTRYPDPADTGAIVPASTLAFSAISRALMDAGDTAYADAMATARSRSHPQDPLPLLVRSRIAGAGGHPALALHFALLARALAPDTADCQLALARATDMRYGISAALAALDEADALALPASERARLDEFRVRLLLRRGTPEALRTAEALTEDLLLHSDDSGNRQRLRTLARDVAAAQTLP